MGLFWNLIQQSQISDQKARASTLEARVAYLENELHKTQQILKKHFKFFKRTNL